MGRLLGSRASWAAASMLLLTAMSVVPRAHAGGGPFAIDYELSYGVTGIWSRSNQLALEYAAPIATAIVNYFRETTEVLALETLPLYDAIARLKSQAHRQSDVIAGWALGTGLGYRATRLHAPLRVRVWPRGLSIGISKGL